MACFYDTCALLNLQEKVLESYFYISSVTFQELERIKTSGTKDEETKFKARRIVNLLISNEDKYCTVIYKNEWDNEIIDDYSIQLNDDARIIYTAFKEHPGLTFVTEDGLCGIIAKKIFNLKVEYSNLKENDEYTGYKEIKFDDIGLAKFYNNIQTQNLNVYDLLENQYLLVNLNGQIVDKFKWFNDEYVQINYNDFNSTMLGKIKPKDAYQACVMDSLRTNQLTVIKGPAGSGKDYLGLGYLFYLLECGGIHKIFIFVNPVATRGAAKLGYLPGDKNSKILDSQIGNFLIGKLGDIEIVYQLIEKGKLILMPISDIRGVDLSGSDAALYITEAQNMSVDMMKLALQRAGEDTLVILNGDTKCQVDSREYEGANSGLNRVSEIFKGKDYYGEVTLKEIYRSRIAKQADEM